MERYNALVDAPKNSINVVAQASLYNTVNKPREALEALLLPLEKGSGHFVAYPNGSFHEYDVIVNYVFSAKKYNPYGYPKYGQYPRTDLDEDVRDFDQLYLPKLEYKYFIEDGIEDKMSILDESDYGPRVPEHSKSFDKVSDLMDFIDSHREKAIQAWKLSRNY